VHSVGNNQCRTGRCEDGAELNTLATKTDCTCNFAADSLTRSSKAKAVLIQTQALLTKKKLVSGNYIMQRGTE